MPAFGQATQYFTQTPTIGGLRGLHLDRVAGDPSPNGIAWDYNGVTAWGSGLDATLGYTYTVNGQMVTVPDLVLAYGSIANADNLRMRADTAQVELGPAVGHPVSPNQLNITAGTAAAPLNGVAVGCFGNVSGLVLVQKNMGTNRTKIQFNSNQGVSLWQMGVDANSNGGNDFWVQNGTTGNLLFKMGTVGTADAMGFFGANPVSKPVVSGSRGGNAALASLITALASLGLVTDNTTP